jgi:hypothetical protein
MNMIDVQDKLKGFSEDQLVREMQSPSGAAPQFLVLSEITRRKRMRDSMQPQDTGTTVAEEVVSAAGLPQGGLATMAQALAPKSSMAQNTAAMPQQDMPEEMPVQRMYGGGYVQKMQAGGIASLMSNPVARAYAEREAQRLGITLEQYLQQAMPPQTNQMLTQFADRQATRNRMLGLEPAGDSITMPTQADLDRRFAESQARPDIFPNSGFSEPGPEMLGFGSYDGGSPPQRPGASTASMTSVPRSIAAGVNMGGRRGMIDSLLASRIPVANPDDYMPPDPFDVRMALAAREDPYYPGPSAATELNLPAFRSPSAGGAGLASGLLAAAEGYRPPVDQGAGRSGFATEMPTREEEAIAARNELLGGLVGRFDQQALQEELMSSGGGRSGFPTVDLDLTVDPGPSPLDRQGNLLALQQEVLEGRAGPMTGNMPPAAQGPEFYPTDLSYIGDALGGAAESVSGFLSQFSGVPESFRTPSGRADRDQQGALPATPRATPPAADETGAGGGADTAPQDTGTPDLVTATDIVTGGGGAGAGGRGAGSGVAAAVGAAPMSSYEQELANAMERADKRANQDKWLALAQVGLGLMSSTQPTLAGALGEAGMAGLGAFQSARDTAEEERLGLTKAMFDIRSARESALAAQRSAGATASSGPSLSEINSAIDMLTTTVNEIDPNTGMEVEVRRAADPNDQAFVNQLMAQRTSMLQARLAPQV